MANEISIDITGVVDNGTERTFDATGLQFDQAAKGARWVTVSVGNAAEEDIVTTEIGTLGWLFMKNLDSTNYVIYGPKSGTMVDFGRIEAGEPAAMRLEPGITITAQANTAAVELDIMILED